MVRAEGLPLWAFDDPPAAERDAIFAEVRGQQPRRPRPPGASSATSSRASTPAPPSPASSPPAGRGGPTSSSARPPSSPGRWRPSSSACRPSCVGISQQGKEERVIPADRRRARRAARARSAWRPTPAAQRLLRRPYFTLLPAALEDPGHAGAAPRRTASASRARRAPPPRSTAGPADDRPLVYVTFGSVAPSIGLLPRRSTAPPSRRWPPAAAPAGDRRARPRPRRPRAAAAQRARRALGPAGRPHAPRGGDGLPRRLGDGDDGPGRRRADGRAAALRRPAVERRARRRAGRGDRARAAVPGRRSPDCARRSCGSPAIRPTARAPSGSPPRCAPCRRSTPRSASSAGCSSTRSPHDEQRRPHGLASRGHAPRKAPRPRGRRLAARVGGARRRRAGDRRRRPWSPTPRAASRARRRSPSTASSSARPGARVVYALHKPAGVVSTAADTHGRRTVVDLVPTGQRLYPVGRLDADSDGPDPAHQRRRPRLRAHPPALRGPADLSGARRGAPERARPARAARGRRARGRPHRAGPRAPARPARARADDPRGPQAPGAADVRGGRPPRRRPAPRRLRVAAPGRPRRRAPSPAHGRRGRAPAQERPTSAAPALAHRGDDVVGLGAASRPLALQPVQAELVAVVPLAGRRRPAVAGRVLALARAGGQAVAPARGCRAPGVGGPVHEAARVGVDDHERQLGRAGGHAGEAQRRPRLGAVAREARRDRPVGREVGARDRELRAAPTGAGTSACRPRRSRRGRPGARRPRGA